MFYSEQKKQFKILNRRTFFLYLFKLTFFSLVGWRLYNIQILDSRKYKTLSKNNQIDVEIIPPLRGEIYDCKNKIIATNNKVFDLYLVPENTVSLNSTLNSLSEFVTINFDKRRKIIDLSKKIKKFEKIKIYENVDWNTLEKIESNKYAIPGIFIAQDSIRIYPFKQIFAHLLGYINKPNQQDLALQYSC